MAVGSRDHSLKSKSTYLSRTNRIQSITVKFFTSHLLSLPRSTPQTAMLPYLNRPHEWRLTLSNHNSSSLLRKWPWQPSRPTPTLARPKNDRQTKHHCRMQVVQVKYYSRVVMQLLTRLYHRIKPSPSPNPQISATRASSNTIMVQFIRVPVPYIRHSVKHRKLRTIMSVKKLF